MEPNAARSIVNNTAAPLSDTCHVVLRQAWPCWRKSYPGLFVSRKEVPPRGPHGHRDLGVHAHAHDPPPRRE